MRSQKQQPELPFDNNLPIEQKNWKKVRFDQIAECINDKVDDPSKAGVDRYVGLEHLDPESLKIRRWGTPDDVEASKLRFKPGDIIFGKRRAYQRKLAVADFEGICSAHAMVLRAREEEVLKDFFPYFLQTDTFFERALSISIGSLSPTINWNMLAKQEFSIPPKDEQRRIADILWSMDEACLKFADVFLQNKHVKRQLLTQLTTKGISKNETQITKAEMFPSAWKKVLLGELLILCQYGLSIPLNNIGKYPIFRMMNLEDGVVVENDMKFVDLSDKDLKTYKLETGDILFNRTNSADLVGKVAIYNLNGDHVFASYLIRLQANKNLVLPEYLNYYLNSDLGQQRILAYATPGVSQTNINADNLKKVFVPLPPIEEQKQIVVALEELVSFDKTIQKQLSYVSKLKKELLNKLLS
ncbi:MAG: restriction endonuclease subunit S [Blastocatellia bacterium]